MNNTLTAHESEASPLSMKRKLTTFPLSELAVVSQEKEDKWEAIR